MKRAIVTAILSATCFFALHGAASAMAEFCPAHLTYEAVAPDSPNPPPAQLYGFDLSALTSRTLTSATLAFDTTAGWYTVAVPSTALSAKVRHYTGNLSFAERDYVSPKMYVRFPQAVAVSHAWVYSAAATGDGFGWEQKGGVICPPPPQASSEQSRHFRNHKAMSVDPKDDDRLSDAPEHSSVLLAAQPSKALAHADCAEPFREATVLDQVTPHYPEAMRGDLAVGMTAVGVVVAITADGRVLDAWVRASSGYAAFDNEALSAARRSTYQGGRAYCQAVPGSYMFDVFFNPNG
ncbi:MAG TPA: TonB family protein [Candidatus Baltobacteraceae bacterium]